MGTRALGIRFRMANMPRMANLPTHSRDRRARRPEPDRRIEVRPEEVFQADPPPDKPLPKQSLEGVILRYALISGLIVAASVVLTLLARVI